MKKLALPPRNTTTMTATAMQRDLVSFSNNASNCNAKGPSLHFGRGGMSLRFGVDPIASLEILWNHSIGQGINFVGAKLSNLRIFAQKAAEQVPVHE